MLFEDFKKTRDRANTLSQCDVLGSFDFYTSIVSLDSLTANDFEEMLKQKDSVIKAHKEKSFISYDAYKALERVQPLAFHEYTHFFDSTSTLWGARYLQLMNLAYTADDQRYGGTEKDFHNAKKFNDLIRFARLPKYYTFKSNVNDESLPWVCRESIGNRFSNNGEVSKYPIIFTQFFNSKGELLVRSPISTISILECSAMAQEITTKMALISMLDDEQRTVEMHMYTERLKNYIYNKDLTEYSVCAHLIANKFKETDVAKVYSASALLCRLVLNTPKAVYTQLESEYDFTSLWGNSEDVKLWIEKVRSGLRYQEPGFLYYLLCTAMDDKAFKSEEEFNNKILKALESLGLDYEALKKESEREFLEVMEKAESSQVNTISMLATAGKQNYLSTDWGNSYIELPNYQIPRALLGDSVEVQLFLADSNRLRDIPLDDIYGELVEGQLWVERFVEACA